MKFIVWYPCHVDASLLLKNSPNSLQIRVDYNSHSNYFLVNGRVVFKLQEEPVVCQPCYSHTFLFDAVLAFALRGLCGRIGPPILGGRHFRGN